MENFLGDIVSKEICFAKEDFIDFRTENGYCFGYFEESVESLHRIIERFLSMNSTSYVTTDSHSRAKGHKRYKK